MECQSKDIVLPETKIVQDKYFFQVVVTIISSISYFSAAQSTGWNSPSIPKLMAPDSPIPLTSEQGSWLIIISIVGLLTFGYPVSLIVDRLGRKPTLLIGMVPSMIGWLFIALADAYWMLMVGRVFFGIAYTFLYYVLPIYLGEIASDKIRGFSITMLQVTGRLGILFIFAVAPYVSISTMAWIGMATPLLFLVTFIWMPESPYFLIGKDKQFEARRSLVKLRGHNEVNAELDRMVATVQRSMENRGTFRELINPENRKGLVNLFVLALFAVLSGNSAILDYSQLIFSKIDTNLEPEVISIILAAVGLVSVFIGNMAIDRAGRKPLLLISAFGCAICTGIVCFYFILSERQGADVSQIGWLPILALMVFRIAYGMGFNLVIFVMLGEIFPKHLKATVGAAMLMFGGVVDIVVSKLFQVISDGAGSDVSFGIFAVCTIAVIPFIIWQVPETKGKSLDEILEIMRQKRKNTKIEP